MTATSFLLNGTPILIDGKAILVECIHEFGIYAREESPSGFRAQPGTYVIFYTGSATKFMPQATWNCVGKYNPGCQIRSQGSSWSQLPGYTYKPGFETAAEVETYYRNHYTVFNHTSTYIETWFKDGYFYDNSGSAYYLAARIAESIS